MSKPQLQICNKLLPTRSSSATVTTSTSFELASSHARVTSIKFTKHYGVSEWVREGVSDKHSQWSDSGPIKIQVRSISMRGRMQFISVVLFMTWRQQSWKHLLALSNKLTWPQWQYVIRMIILIPTLDWCLTWLIANRCLQKYAQPLTDSIEVHLHLHLTQSQML